jgi:hypothetical protein
MTAGVAALWWSWLYVRLAPFHLLCSRARYGRTAVHALGTANKQGPAAPAQQLMCCRQHSQPAYAASSSGLVSAAPSHSNITPCWCLVQAGFEDPRVVEASEVVVHDPQLSGLLGSAAFYSITFRLFKLPGLDAWSEDYGQAATYKGSLPGCGEAYTLDAGHVFRVGESVRVCRNTAAMLQRSWLGPHFEVTGDTSHHRGMFCTANECSLSAASVATMVAAQAGSSGAGGCCPPASTGGCCPPVAASKGNGCCPAPPAATNGGCCPAPPASRNSGCCPAPPASSNGGSCKPSGGCC